VVGKIKNYFITHNIKSKFTSRNLIPFFFDYYLYRQRASGLHKKTAMQTSYLIIFIALFFKIGIERSQFISLE